jgi:DNA-binding transcriptional LysR family regulator
VRCFVAEVSTSIEHLDHAVQTAGAISDGMEGTLNIGLHGSIASGFLAGLRRRYQADYPAIEQTVIEGRSSEAIALVANALRECGARGKMIRQADGDFRPAYAPRRVGTIRPNPAIPIAELDQGIIRARG